MLRVAQIIKGGFVWLPSPVLPLGLQEEWVSKGITAVWMSTFEMYSFCGSCKAACAVAKPIDGEWVPTSCCTTQGGASPWPGMSGSPGFPPDEKGKRKSEAMNWWDFLKGVEKGSQSWRWWPPLCFGPMWPILHWMSCFTPCIFGNSAETGATAVVKSLLAIREVFKKGLCLPQLLRSGYCCLDDYLDKLHCWEKGKNPLQRVEPCIQ